jgi:hypothetical protein
LLIRRKRQFNQLRPSPLLLATSAPSSLRTQQHHAAVFQSAESSESSAFVICPTARDATSVSD